MNCPYCGKPMAEGYVTGGAGNRDNAYWRPKTKGAREWFTRRYKEALLLARGKFGKAEAWYCPKCGKIVLDVPEQEEE